MFDGIGRTANRLLESLRRSFLRDRRVLPQPPQTPSLPRSYERLRRVVLTDEVSRTLFAEYETHRMSGRGEEEIGWLLLGVREADHAVVLATVPAGSHRDAGAAHVKFDSNAQAIAARLLRQRNKHLKLLGVAHTHPGTLRHPSGGDYTGDSQWVRRLPGREGVFAIGTLEDQPPNGAVGASSQVSGNLMISWYALADGDGNYRKLEVQLTPGPDLALPLRNVWETVEGCAEPLERLCVQQAGVILDVVPGQSGSALAAKFKLAEPGNFLVVVLEGTKAAIYWQRGQELLTVESPSHPCESSLDRAVYLVLADLAGRRQATNGLTSLSLFQRRE